MHQTAATLLPLMRIMSAFPAASDIVHCLPKTWAKVWQAQLIVEDNLAADSLARLPYASEDLEDGVEDEVSE